MKKDNTVETVRGLACILLVAYHVVGDTSLSGLKVADDSFIRYINDTLSYLRMPLFTFLSGYVYAIRPYSGGAYSFLKGKARRLLIPMLIVGTAFAILQSLVPQSNRSLSSSDWLMLHIEPVAHYWFLESLFIIFIFTIFMEKGGILNSRAKCAFTIILVSIIYLFGENLPNTLGVSGALYLFPYFLLGVATYRFSLVPSKWSYKLAIFLIAIVAFVYANLGLLGYAETVGRHTITSLCIGGGGALLLLSSRLNSRVLVYIGGYSYSIYLFHVFATSSSRIFLNKLGVSEHLILLPIGVVAGLLMPILVEHIALRWNVSATALLGRRWTAEAAR
ncbi:acyltransferase family protein [Corallincola luteus]|uniref:acyltransferase family protein n=1 Tax=Corallincola luteus TaxID=1775177 RepID=UPI0013F3CB13|nr:acyltransferase [Corallincola luteus]